MNADSVSRDSPPSITAKQIADELGTSRGIVSTIAARLRLGTWGRVRKGHGYAFTPEEAEQLRAVVRYYLEERRRRER